jgi:putative ABC transport system permease protein
MATFASTPSLRALRAYQQWLPDLQLGWQNLLLHRLRSLLTMLGMIFGVAAVVSMLSIGAGARQKVMAMIEQMGVHNLIVEAKETTEWQAHQKVRKISQGLTFQDYRVIRDDVADVVAGTPRKRMTPSKTLPKSQLDPPTIYGVDPVYMNIAGLHVLQGRFFSDNEQTGAAPVCVLGAAARSSLFGSSDPIGQYVKANETWFRVIGVVSPQLSSQTEVAGVPSQDVNNIMYVPLNSAILRLEDNYSDVRDEIDGIYLNIRESADMSSVAQVVRAILDSSHHSAGDFSVIVPAELLAEQRRTERLFNAVMVAIASISLLVGGIGIMNIMLASILERTRERHYPAVCRRGCLDLFHGRKLRNRVRLHHVAADRMARRMVNHRYCQLDPFGIPGFDHSWIGVRDLPCSQGGPSGPSRGDSLRIAAVRCSPHD